MSKIDGIPVSESEFQRRVENGSAVGDVFRNGRYVGSINLSRNIFFSRIRIVFDVYRVPHDLINDPTTWYSYYDHSYEEEFEISGAQTKPDQKSGKPQDAERRPLTNNETDILFSELKKLISNPDCATFIQSLLAQLKTDTGRQQYGTTDILQLFEAVKAGSGFEWDPDIAAQATGGQSRGAASVTIKPSLMFANLANKSPGYMVYRARTIVHELFHVAGYGHDAMALAAYRMGERFDSSWHAWTGDFPNREDKLFKTADPKEGAARLDGAYSGFFGNVLNQHCK